jgi:tetraacyldisaccharide 4'-kinase
MTGMSLFYTVVSGVWTSVNRVARSINASRAPIVFPMPVVSVGNIQAGGSGKTPMVIEVVRLLRELGFRPAVVTRGYRSKVESEGGILLAGKPSHPIEYFGDEAIMIHEKTGCPVFVGKNRERVVTRYFNDLPVHERPNFFVLDDGLQQFRLKKDLEIVCLTDAVPGDVVFRESFSSLKENHFLVLTKLNTFESFEGKKFSALSDQQHLNGQVRILTDLRALKSTTTDSSFVLLTGFVGGERLRDELIQEGFSVSHWFEFSDHHPYTHLEIEEIERQRAQRLILTSEKDWAKIRNLTKTPETYRVIPLEVSWVFGKAELKERLCKLSPKSS